MNYKALLSKNARSLMFAYCYYNSQQNFLNFILDTKIDIFFRNNVNYKIYDIPFPFYLYLFLSLIYNDFLSWNHWHHLWFSRFILNTVYEQGIWCVGGKYRCLYLIFVRRGLETYLNFFVCKFFWNVAYQIYRNNFRGY